MQTSDTVVRFPQFRRLPAGLDVDAYRRTRGFRNAERALGYVAVCLIGPPRPVRFQTGNALHWPLSLRTTTDPARAAQRTVSEHWEGSKDDPPVVVLEYVWTRSDAHASRLKGAVYARLLGNDPDMRLLNGAWVDLMDWGDQWRSILIEAVRDLRAGGETRFEDPFSEQERVARIYWHEHGSMAGRK